MDEKITMLVVLKQGSETEKFFYENYDALHGDHRVLACSNVDLSGYHAKIVRITQQKLPKKKNPLARQTFWLPTQDIALVFDYESRRSFGFAK